MGRSIWSPLIVLLLLYAPGTLQELEQNDPENKSITEYTQALSEKLVDLFNSVTFANTIADLYKPNMQAQRVDPRRELAESKREIEKYLEKRAKYAFAAKQSLESRELSNMTDEEVNDDKGKNFIRYTSVKKGNDATVVYPHNHLGEKTEVAESFHFTWTVNANFYHMNTSSNRSAVHVPTPIYDRDPELLQKMAWSEIDVLYKSKRDQTSDLGFQLFCSESGFMRFFPATTWYWESEENKLDLFDCRNTEWYINSATCSKNVIIMLDMSGSMLGQRFEIAKQTTEAIMETLSHNDYFNMMIFSKEVNFLDGCKGTAGLLQATMRNKKDIRAMLDNNTAVTSEGKAEYEIALAAAFGQLLQIENATSAPANPGCENVIMLITDGAPQRYEKVFEKYNKEKKVRFFSFLIGEEAIDFDQVKWMACNNAGFMVHIANMADVEEKVQHYIRVMSRPVGYDAAQTTVKEAMWSGVYRERLFAPRNAVFDSNDKTTDKTSAQLNKLASKKKIHIRRQEARSRMFVTTVSYPVTVNNTFMGVAAVNIPLTEISQLAAPMLIGARSYYFMLDRNGFVMFHPQLRAMEQKNAQSRVHKPNYNNMDILELEVPEDSEIRELILNCDNKGEAKIKMLFASDSLDRVYPQSNSYYMDCVGKNKDFVLGLAISDTDTHRIGKKANFTYDQIDISWFDDPSETWRIHPHWRYCMVNDTDSDISREAAFVIYVKQMMAIKDLPPRCRERERLVERLMFDMKSTAPLIDKWKANTAKMHHHLAHVVYFTSPSGMIRFYNVTLKNFEYNHIGMDALEYAFAANISSSAFSAEEHGYQHFIMESNRKSVDDRYYRRAIRNDGVIVFDVNYKSMIWYKEETMSPFGFKENETMLFSAYKSVQLENGATLGVSGMELGYDHFVSIMNANGCKVRDQEKWCLLLDEHGYVFYSNQRKYTNYKAFYDETYQINRGHGYHLAIDFGRINRLTQRTMELLVDKKFYFKYKYQDHQAICEKKDEVPTSGSRPETWLRSVVKLLLSTLLRLLKRFEAYTAFGFVHNLIQPVQAYTSSFHDVRESSACTKTSDFYFANRNISRRLDVDLVDGGNQISPCDAPNCHIRLQASFVENTNLLMVWIIQDKGSTVCFDQSKCPMGKSSVNLLWEVVPESTKAGWQTPVNQRCLKKDVTRPGGFFRCTNRTREEEEASHPPCSGVAPLSMALLSLVTLLSKWLL